MEVILNVSSKAWVIGCDVDPSALATASVRLQDYIVKLESKDSVTNVEGNEKEEAIIEAAHDKPIFIPLKSYVE